jgi:hypothetical protein
VTRAELTELQNQTFVRCSMLLERKNKDYAGESTDALSNFKCVEHFGITSATQGVLVRLTDKYARVVNILKSGKINVQSETLEDTIDDAINYLVILKGTYRDAVGTDPQVGHPGKQDEQDNNV